MIVFDLSCDNAHTFEGWFSSSTDFAEQLERGLVDCPVCGSENVTKAPMAPAVPAKGNARSATPDSALTSSTGHDGESHAVANTPMPAELANALNALAKAQAKALKGSEWVGDKFADEARAMHYGEKDTAAIHGQATRKEAESLIEEGVSVAPLIVPVSPPDELN